MTAIHTCDHCNCPKCLLQRAGRDNPAVQAALQEAWTDETAAWGIPPNVGGAQYLTEYAEEYPAPFYAGGNMPVQRAYNDPANPLNYGTDRFPRLYKGPILGVIPRRKPADALEWAIVIFAGTIVSAIVGTVIWIGYQVKLMVDNTGAYLSAHGTQIITAIVVIGIIGLLAAMVSSGGGGKGRSFSGEFTGRMH